MDIALNSRRIPLAHGNGALPALGFGSLIADRGAVKPAIKAALEAGFRHFDGAELFQRRGRDRLPGFVPRST